MCGIAGVHRLGQQGFVDFMQKALGHRGPDGQTRVGLTTMLSWCRLDWRSSTCRTRAPSPFHSRDGRITVIYNGEIYNHGQLRGRHGLDAAPAMGPSSLNSGPSWVHPVSASGACLRCASTTISSSAYGSPSIRWA